MEKLLTTAEASSIFNLSKAWFEKRRWAGDGPPYIKLGHKTVRYDESKLREWFQQFEIISE